MIIDVQGVSFSFFDKNGETGAVTEEQILKNIDLKISEIPFKDPSIFSLISNNQTMGIFQLDTSAANKGITYIKPANFNEIVDLLALDRPGPMEQIPLYARRKEKKEKGENILN